MIEITNEATLRGETVKALRKLGYTVLIVGGGLPKCSKCGSRVTTGNGSSPGVPDLFITHPSYPRSMWVAVELKWANGQLRESQKKLKDAMLVEVFRKLDDVVGWCEGYREEFGDDDE